MSEFEEYITDLGLVEFAGWHFDKDECDEYLHEPTNVAHNIWRDKEHTVKNQQSKIDELSLKLNGAQFTLNCMARNVQEYKAEIDEALQLLSDWGDQTYRDDVEQLIGELGDVLRGES